MAVVALLSRDSNISDLNVLKHNVEVFISFVSTTTDCEIFLAILLSLLRVRI